ncbi:glycosyltransferase family 2 protein [Spirochaeta isovalerica]|uniref:Glycosyltransferase involved in cell wall biosynthesis n=1 Tax=Spirochaeta isovalerica TaxID=150 RepID=A0A841RHZ8_9SPIO|nr:glycosyltransferase family A protein [Spirochaeta isovalerica]MBB6482630.1 glycosyltransferase involved in cell wall biosynthesis [Spirochaeta isovalerica]
MSEKVSVSVIIPVFNRKEAIHEAVKSVFDQTFRDWELIIADDGSDDGTFESLKEYEGDRRVQIIRLAHNGNPGYVRNRAVDRAAGRWIAFLDSDDLWNEEKLDRQISYMNDHRECLFLHTREVWSREGKIISQSHRKHKREGDLFEVSLGKCEIGPSTVLMDREMFTVLGGFREDLEICEDYEFWLRVTSRYSVGYIDEDLIVKRAGGGDQLSFKYGFIENFKIDALKNLIDSKLLPLEKEKVARKELARKCRIYGKGCRKRGREKEAEKYDSLYFFYMNDDGHREK